MRTLPGGGRCQRGCGVHPGMGTCCSRCNPFGETYSKALCYSSWRKMCYCFIRISAGDWAMAGTMAMLELPGWGPPGWRRSSEQVPEHEPRPRRARSMDTRAGEEPDEVPMSFPSHLLTAFATSNNRHSRNHGKSKTPEIMEPISPRGEHESGVL